jgi:hypothetical protein
VARTIREKVGTEKERKERRSGKGMGSEGVKEGKKDRNGEGEGTKGESWNSKGRKVKVLERKGIGNGNGTNVGESGKIGMEGKRRRTRERGSVPWSKRKAPRIRNDGSLNLVWERREGKEQVGKWGIGRWERGTRGKEGNGS